MTRLPGDPSAGRKVLFAIGFRLPDRNREWVRHELTDAGWRGRLTWRHLLVTLPFAAVLAAFPGPLFIHIMVPALFLICSVGIVAMYANDIRVSRLQPPRPQAARRSGHRPTVPLGPPAVGLRRQGGGGGGGLARPGAGGLVAGAGTTGRSGKRGFSGGAG